MSLKKCRYILLTHDIIIFRRDAPMEETLKLILEKLGKLEEKTNKLDKIESDINSLKADSKVTHQKLNMIIDEVANYRP